MNQGFDSTRLDLLTWLDLALFPDSTRMQKTNQVGTLLTVFNVFELIQILHFQLQKK